MALVTALALGGCFRIFGDPLGGGSGSDSGGTGDAIANGDSSGRKLGYGEILEDIGDDEFPNEVPPVALGDGAVGVSAGENHTCALLETGDANCWGGNADGQLGYGTVDAMLSVTDLEALSLDGVARAMEADFAHTCALLETGDLFCWGYNYYGQLGYGHTDNIGDDEVPSDVGPVSFQ